LNIVISPNFVGGISIPSIAKSVGIVNAFCAFLLWEDYAYFIFDMKLQSVNSAIPKIFRMLNLVDFTCLKYLKTLDLSTYPQTTMSDAVTPSYDVFDHSGDLRIEARGRDCLEALAHASSGLVAQIVPLALIDEVEERSVTISGDDDTGRYIGFLNEILFLIYARQWLPRRVRLLRQCTQNQCRELEAVLVGEPFDATRHELRHDIKAVTYHDFQIRQEGDVATIHFVCDL
jgi:SHS2 domain-containing protein